MKHENVSIISIDSMDRDFEFYTKNVDLLGDNLLKIKLQLCD